MKSFLLTALILTVHLTCQAEDTAALVKDPKVKHRVPVVAALILFEATAAGFSWYSAQPQYYGDKIMGGIYAATSVAFLAVSQSEWRANHPTSWKIGNAVTMIGLSYGMARLALYNLTADKKEPSNKRVVRNFVEFNAAYMIPFSAGMLTELLLEKHNKKSASRTALHFAGTGMMLTIGL
jgi:hypothetical protein